MDGDGTRPSETQILGSFLLAKVHSGSLWAESCSTILCLQRIYKKQITSWQDLEHNGRS